MICFTSVSRFTFFSSVHFSLLSTFPNYAVSVPVLAPIRVWLNTIWLSLLTTWLVLIQRHLLLHISQHYVLTGTTYQLQFYVLINTGVCAKTYSKVMSELAFLKISSVCFATLRARCQDEWSSPHHFYSLSFWAFSFSSPLLLLHVRSLFLSVCVSEHKWANSPHPWCSATQTAHTLRILSFSVSVRFIEENREFRFTHYTLIILYTLWCFPLTLSVNIVATVIQALIALPTSTKFNGVFSPLPFPVALITHFMSLWWVWQTQGIAFFCVMWWESGAVTMNPTHVHLCRWLSLLRPCRMHRWFAKPSDFCPAAGRLENWIISEIWKWQFRGLGGYHCRRVWLHY